MGKDRKRGDYSDYTDYESKIGLDRTTDAEAQATTMSDGVQIRRDERGRALELHPAMQAKLWQPGHAPNPSGKSGEWQRCLKLCRENSHDAAAEVIRLGKESDDDRVRFMANTWVYERAWGKAKEFDPKAETTGVPMFDPRQVTPKQLEMIKQAMQLMAAAMTVVEVVDEGQ